MNILVFSWRDPKHPLAGGAEQVDHEHHKGWIAAGHNVTLFSSKFLGAKDEEFVDNVKIIRKGSQYLTCHIYAFVWYLFNKHDAFDLAVDEFHGWPFFTPFYIKKPKLAVIQEVTREVWLKYPLPYGLNYILGGIGYVLEPLFFLPYRNIEFMIGSESAKNELSAFGINKKNITVVPHGVLLDLPKKLSQRELKKTVIFLGALAKDKGIEDAITAFSVLNKKGDYQFWVVGKGDRDYLEFLKGLAKRNNVNVKFFGFVLQKEKFQLLSRAHVMINPSIREGFGLVNIEANAVGTPVVAYNSPGLTDSVKDGVSGILCKKNSPEELAKEVSDILNDTEKYNELQKGAIEWSKKFNWENSRKLSLALIEKIGLK
ncbi:glycosyltransferase family 4 protein [soil metagenome]